MLSRSSRVGSDDCFQKRSPRLESGTDVGGRWSGAEDWQREGHSGGSTDGDAPKQRTLSEELSSATVGSKQGVHVLVGLLENEIPCNGTGYGLRKVGRGSTRSVDNPQKPWIQQGRHVDSWRAHWVSSGGVRRSGCD